VVEASIKVKDGSGDIDKKDFYQQNSKLIGDLQGEFCQEQEGGWLKVVEEPRGQPGQTGKWTKQEHDSFLEALRIYGKDWDRVQQAVGTRDRRNVVSHA